MKHTLFSVLFAVLFCLCGIWGTAAADSGFPDRKLPPQESFQPIVSPSEPMEAALRYLSGVIHTYDENWTADLASGELLMAPRERSAVYGINTYHFTALKPSSGSLTPFCEFYVDDQGWIWKATPFEITLLGNFTGQYDFNFTAPEAAMAQMTYSGRDLVYTNPPVAVTTEEALRYCRIVLENHLPQYINPGSQNYALLLDEIGGAPPLGIWSIRIGEDRPDRFVTWHHAQVYSTGEIKIMDILTGKYKTVWR